MLELLTQAGAAVAILLTVVWLLPNWMRKWIGVARDLRDYRSGR